MDCLTCHLPHPDGAEQASGRRLRLPNLRRELCLACHCQQADAPRIEIISPLERAVVRDDHVALIGRASHLPEDLLTVRINGSAFSVHAKNGNFFTRLTLREGTNRIAVEQAGRALWEGEVFQGRDSSDHYGRTSSGHGTANREECLGCHVTQDGVGAGVSGGAPTHCYGCHDRIEGKRYVHGPLAVGDCLACHDPHGGFGDAHLRREAGPLCRGCHPAGEHGPATACATAGKGCVECHDPHQSDARYLLRGPRYTMRAPFPDPPPVPEAPPAR